VYGEVPLTDTRLRRASLHLLAEIAVKWRGGGLLFQPGNVIGSGVALRLPALAWVAVWAGTAGWSCWSRTGWALRLGVAVRWLAESAGFRLVAVESPLRPSRRALFCSMGPPRTTANLGGFSGVRVWLAMFLSRGFVVARALKVCDRIC